jgi:DNA modification methylase
MELIQGHVLDVLRTMPDESVNCVVTSPPYWGLRDYGLEPQVWSPKGSGQGAGAWRGSLGLEPDPALYVAHLVEIFREVRRVLRKDGTLWLNLGSSFASVQSRPVHHGESYDTDDKERSDYQGSDHVYPRSDGEHQGGNQTHLSRNIRNDQERLGATGPPCMTNHDIGPSDSAKESLDVLLPGVPASTKPGFWLRLQAGCSRSDNPFSCPSFSCSCFPDAQEFFHKTVCTSDISRMLPPSVDHIQGKESSFSALEPPNGLIRDSIATTPPNVKFKPKDLVGIPWRAAFALQADGWWLRSDIIWSKVNPMPESVTDRPTKAHEYVFMMTKAARYYWNQDAVREPLLPESHARYKYALQDTCNTYGQHKPGFKERKKTTKVRNPNPSGRNIRSVWTIATQPLSESHYATFPEALVEPCVKAGCPEGGVVLDPFMGSGTVGVVAARWGCRFIGIELNPEYIELARRRIQPSLIPAMANRGNEPCLKP